MVVINSIGMKVQLGPHRLQWWLSISLHGNYVEKVIDQVQVRHKIWLDHALIPLNFLNGVKVDMFIFSVINGLLHGMYQTEV